MAIEIKQATHYCTPGPGCHYTSQPTGAPKEAANPNTFGVYKDGVLDPRGVFADWGRANTPGWQFKSGREAAQRYIDAGFVYRISGPTSFDVEDADERALHGDAEKGRDENLAGTAFDRSERHYPEGA